MNKAEKNGMWAGDNVGYNALHEWVKNHIEKPKACNKCGKEKKLDCANISQEYRRDLNDWEWLCRSCHMIKDGRLKKLHEGNRKHFHRSCVVCGIIFLPRGETYEHCSRRCAAVTRNKIRALL